MSEWLWAGYVFGMLATAIWMLQSESMRRCGGASVRFVVACLLPGEYHYDEEM